MSASSLHGCFCRETWLAGSTDICEPIGFFICSFSTGSYCSLLKSICTYVCQVDALLTLISNWKLLFILSPANIEANSTQIFEGNTQIYNAKQTLEENTGLTSKTKEFTKLFRSMKMSLVVKMEHDTSSRWKSVVHCYSTEETNTDLLEGSRYQLKHFIVEYTHLKYIVYVLREEPKDEIHGYNYN